MRVLLTGATGLLGNNVLEALLNVGHDVTMIVRNPDGIVAVDIPVDARRRLCEGKNGQEAVLRIGNSEIRIFRGNITDPTLMCEAAVGCDAIINCAGDTCMSHRRLEDYYPVNRDLCATLLKAAAGSVTTVVHISTANTIGYGLSDSLSDEQSPMLSPFTESLYALSKLEGEKILLNSLSDSTERKVRIIILNPGYIIGKYDVKPSSGKLLLAGWRKLVMFVPPGGKSFVSARTVAQAAVAALTRGSDGERYLTTGENLSFRKLLEIESIVGGYRQRVVELPRVLCKMVGVVGDVLAKCGLNVTFTSRNINQLLIREHYSNQKMVSEFGVEPRSIAAAIADFVEYRKLNRNKE